MGLLDLARRWIREGRDEAERALDSQRRVINGWTATNRQNA
jgi:hypothetical protein